MLIDRTDDSILAKWWLGIDKRLLFLVGFLILIGFVMMFEASPYAAVRQQHGEFFYIRKYPLYLCLGMISMLVMSMMPAERIRRLAPYAFALVFVATVATLFMPAIKNSHRWLRLGSMSVQPSEFLKPVAAVFLASLLATLKNGEGKWMKTKIALMFTGIIATLMSQTDFGMSMTFAAIFGVEIFLAGAKKRWILALVAVLALGSFAAYRHIPQVHNRIERFLSDKPEDRRQVDASLEAIRGA
ncbi:MAG: FtsW/RodA/SpoVE family cell cycle protein, partial [Rickettsiales bacterium]|nr:FtsW/RodA/SpoVE family cell cycle protein [Rickettsiales bacterium]